MNAGDVITVVVFALSGTAAVVLFVARIAAKASRALRAALRAHDRIDELEQSTGTYTTLRSGEDSRRGGQ